MRIDENIIETKLRLAGLHGKARFLIYDEVSSTNALCKKIALDGEDEGLVVIADHQTNGYGRYGRSFYSPSENGLYMSVLLRPDMSYENSVLITAAAAVAVAEAVEKCFSVKTNIKWVNDVLIGEKKVCGILAESGVSDINGKPDYVVLGIGVNISLSDAGFPDEIKDSAGCITDIQTVYSREILCAEIVSHFFAYYNDLGSKKYYSEYIKRLSILGKKVDVTSYGKYKFTATAVGIDENFELIVKKDDNTLCTLSSGEVSARLSNN